MLFERGDTPAVEASGNPVGVVKPFVTRAQSAADDFHHAAFSELQAWLTPADWRLGSGFRPVGAVQLTEGRYPESERYTLVDAREASERAGCKLPSGGLFFADAGYLNPSAFCRTAVAHPLITLRLRCTIDLQARDGAWELVDQDGGSTRVRAVIVASGTGIAQSPWTNSLPMTPARGQISRFACPWSKRPLQCVVAGRHYAIPHDDTLYVGATFDRGDTRSDVRENDHAANRSGLRALLPGIDIGTDSLSGHAGVRATTPDRFPFAGPMPDSAHCAVAYADLARGLPASRYPPLPVIPGLAVLGGLGSRGIVLAPFVGNLLADWLCGGRELQAWMPLLNPVRFQVRALRRSVPAT